MGCILSCNSSQPFDCVRVIHINGYIENFTAPITVSQVTGKPPKHVLCSSAHLLSFGALPLRHDDPLEPGRLYFLLPHTVFQSDTSPVDLASLVTRLTATARRGGPGGQTGPGSVGPEGEIGSGVGIVQGGRMMGSRALTWKPELDTIQERSMRSMNSSNSGGSTREGLA